MFKNKVRTTGFILAVVTLLSCLCFSVSASSTVKSGDFIFNVGKSSATVVEYIGNSTSVKIPSKVNKKPVTAIADYAFSQNKKMSSITIPDSVKQIGEAAFNECIALKKVVLPENLTKIKSAAFWSCTSLKTVVMKQNVTSFGQNIFKWCNKPTVYVYSKTKAETYVKSCEDVTLGYMTISSLKTDSSISVPIGQTKKLSITISPSKVYNSKLTYTSSDTNVATVSSSGVVTAKKCGTCTITVKSNDSGKKSCKTTITVTPAKITKLNQSAVTATSYTLSWAKANGATKYALYKYNDNTKNWDRISTSKTSYTYSNLPLGSTGKFKIKAYVKVGKTNIYGPMSSTFSFSTLKPANVSTLNISSSTQNSVTLSWKKAANANLYKIYSYNAAKKTYTLLASTSALSYTVKNLSPNSEYSYAVKSGIKNANKELLCTSYSKTVSFATAPSAVSGLTANEKETTAKTITLHWNKLSGVDGYEILHCKKGSSWQAAIKISNNATLSYQFENLENGKEYQFKIRAYDTHFGKTYYSPYSNTITVKTKALPTTASQAVDYLALAFEKASLEKSNFKLFVNSSVSDIEASVQNEQSAAAKEAIENQFNKSQVIYNFLNGKEKTTNLSLSKTLAPSCDSLAFSGADAKSDSIKYDTDGGGFNVEFEFEKTDICPLTCTLDLDAIEEASGMQVQSVSYQTKVCDTKVKDGYPDNLKAQVSFSLTLQGEEQTLLLSGTYTYFYVFFWN